tara:strand:- start:126 stop:665 length:540 start_codon:yes stop_codon:yes gene_type:complete
MSEVMSWEWSIAKLKGMRYSILWRDGQAVIDPEPDREDRDKALEHLNELAEEYRKAVILMMKINKWANSGKRKPVDRWRELHTLIFKHYDFICHEITVQDLIIRWAANKHSMALSPKDTYHIKVDKKLSEQLPEALMQDQLMSEVIMKKIEFGKSEPLKDSRYITVEEAIKKYPKEEIT